MSDELFAKNYLQDLGSLLPKLDARRWARPFPPCERSATRANDLHLRQRRQRVDRLADGRRHRERGLLQKKGPLQNDRPYRQHGHVSAYANDEGYEVVFVEPLKNFATAGDLLIAISGSGNSPNVLRAVEYANSIGCTTLGLTSGESGKLRELVKLPLLVPSRHMGRLEDCFFVFTHVLCYAFMEAD